MKYSISKAVCEVLEELPEGKKIYGFELCRRVRHKMRIRGTGRRPLDSTILRRVREHRHVYGMTSSLGGGISEYKKTPKVKV